MPCLLCEKKIPVRRQLAGSQFCSEEHSDQHAALQKSSAMARLAQAPRSEPKPARFAVRPPEAIPQFGRITAAAPFARSQPILDYPVANVPAIAPALQDPFPMSPGMAGVAQPAFRGRLEPRSFGPNSALFASSGAAYAKPEDRRQHETYSLSGEPNAIQTAGLIVEDDARSAQPGFSGPLYIPCDFPFCPVWLPALFDDVGGIEAAVRRWANPMPTLAPVFSCDNFIDVDGPGFSGILACPSPCSAFWEFRGDWTPPADTVCREPYARGTPYRYDDSEPLMPTRPQQSSESLRDRALRLWRQTPAFARGMALAVPLMVPSMFLLPKMSSQTPLSAGGSWAAAIQARATVDLEDDFHAGFIRWSGKPGWESTWSLDGNGSAQPGRLALYRETAPLADYRLEFSGQILAKALSFVFRASDTSNYQAVKIAIVKPGPLASIALVRYTVIDGREGHKTQMPIPVTVRSDTLYKLLVAVEGDHFTVNLNGLFADAWSDDRLKSGGVGFFADKGEVARIRSVHVIDKEGFLGLLCSKVSQWTADKRTIGVKHE